MHGTTYLQNVAKKAHSASPAQIFLGRRMRTPLHPTTAKSSHSWLLHSQEGLQDQARMTASYNWTASQEARDFCVNDHVLVHKVQGKNVPAIVVSRSVEPRSYLARFANITQSIQNRKFLTSLPRFQISPVPDFLSSSPTTTWRTPGWTNLLQQSAPSNPPWTHPSTPTTGPSRSARLLSSLTGSNTENVSAPTLRQNPFSPSCPSTYITRSG